MALRIVIGDVTIGIQGQDFSYIFSVGCGGMESLYKDGKEWLYRTPRPAFWRAVTDNDRGCGFAFRSAVWSAADRFVRCSRVEARMDGEEIAIPLAPANNKYTGKETCDRFEMIYTYETPTVPATEVTVTYTVETDGRIHVQAEYRGQQGLPELPVFGMRFLMPTAAEGYIYEGLSGETYPDRMAGGIPGVYEVQGLPYTAQELENAMHHEELPPARRTVVSILGAVRGVGGINSWGADVEDIYHISGEQDISYGFWIE